MSTEQSDRKTVEDQREMQQRKGKILKQIETAQLLASAERELADYHGIVEDSVAELSDALHRWAKLADETDKVNDLIALLNAATLDEFPRISPAPRSFAVNFAFTINVDAVSELEVIEQLESGQHDDAITAAYRFNISSGES